MLDELFDALDRKSDRRRDDRHGHGHHSDFNDYSENDSRDRSLNSNNYRKHSQDFNFGHQRLTDLLHNKKIMTAILIMAPIVLLLLVGIVILAFPTISRLWNFASTNGVKGIVEAALPFVQQFWEGSKG